MFLTQKKYFIKIFKDILSQFLIWNNLVFGRVAIFNFCNSVSAKINLLNAALPI